jgi:hypothetical protein
MISQASPSSRSFWVFARHDLADERLEQRNGDVIYAVEAQVLEDVQSHALSGARDTADDDEPQRFPHAEDPAQR